MHNFGVNIHNKFWQAYSHFIQYLRFFYSLKLIFRGNWILYPDTTLRFINIGFYLFLNSLARILNYRKPTKTYKCQVIQIHKHLFSGLGAFSPSQTQMGTFIHHRQRLPWSYHPQTLSTQLSWYQKLKSKDWNHYSPGGHRLSLFLQTPEFDGGDKYINSPKKL